MKNGNNNVIHALVVDDNEVNTLVLTNILKFLGITAQHTNSGKKAVSLNQTMPFDMIFIDHIMPEMDGIMTTAELRRTSYQHKQSVIIGLTSKITDQLVSQYREAGANDLYEKPISPADIKLILKKWFPQLDSDILPKNNDANIRYIKNELIQSFIETIDDIDYQSGLKYAIQNPKLYMRILEVSLKDLISCIKIIINSRENNSMADLRLGVHKLSNVYSNIGAIRLSEETNLFEKAILKNDISYINTTYPNFLNHLETFVEKLQLAVNNYHSTMEAQVTQKKLEGIPMTRAEYEQSLIKAIYYIRRYEYEFIIRELENLVRRGFPYDKSELERSINEIMNYDYENALIRLTRLKNKTGNLPVPEG